MINYSIVMRSVNSNLFTINQAKARIKKAVENGEAPNSADLALVKTETQKAYAVAQYSDVMTIDKFARHIATHGCVYSRADIAAILYLAVDCMREQLLEGKKIRMGELGDFSVSLASKGAETADKFTAQNITGVKVAWEPGTEFKSLLEDAEFNQVASRDAQAALLKAIKAGQTTVDITGTAGTDNGSGSDTDSGSGSGTDSGSGSGTDSGSGSGSTDQGGSSSGSGSSDSGGGNYFE